MIDFTALETEVTEIKGVVDSAVALLNQLADELEANASAPAKILEIAASIRSHKEALAAAVANPGQNPPPPPTELKKKISK